MSNRRDLLLLGALFTILFVFVALAPTQQEETQQATPTTYSAGPAGTQALLRWSQELGYNARRLEYRSFSLSDDDAVLLIFNPSVSLNRTDADEVMRWVNEGGTLLVVDSQLGLFNSTSTLLRALKLQTRPIEGDTSTIEQVTSAQPLFSEPPVGTIEVRTNRALEPERNDYAILVGTQDNPLLIGLEQGAGYVYAATTLHPFTNEGLRDPNNAAFVLNLLQRFPTEGRILFDEYHHGYFTPPSLRSVIVSQPWGWGLLLACGAVALYLALTGRRFGKAVPLQEDVALRSSAEYVESVADLFQRGGKRDYIGLHYHTAFKRRLGRPFGINPALEDDGFLRELSRYRDIDAAQLGAIFATLRQRNLSEDALVQTVALADKVASR